MKSETRPVFIAGTRGPLFALYLPSPTPPRAALLYVPPFAEEMNRCRALATEQARQLAARGVSCLLLDPYGTGDSAGNLEDADWSLWQSDTLVAADWLQQASGVAVSLWGLRLGALLAANVCEDNPGRFQRILLWQPVINGKQYLTQYLRLRVAWLMERDLPPETTDQIRERLADEGLVEVAGYPISGTLAAGIDGARFPAGDCSLKGLTIDWLENVGSAEAGVSIGAQKAIAQLEARSATVRPATFVGPPLWQLHKRDELPALIAATCALFGEPL